MKKLFLMAIIIIYPLSNCISMSDDQGEIDITCITPIKSGMDSEKRREAIKSFLKEHLKSESRFDINEVCEAEDVKISGREIRIFTLKDQSKWVFCRGDLERFIGYIYLRRVIDYLGLKTTCAAESKFMLMPGKSDISVTIHPSGKGRLKDIPVIDSPDFCTFSRYYGDERVEFYDRSYDLSNDLLLLIKYGFLEISNIRKKDEKFYVFDTEYDSFDNNGTTIDIDQTLENTFSFSASNLGLI